jgi:eukaryotic-like serine/threonine-protein kinase
MEKNFQAMTSVRQSSPQSRCPSRQELADFSTGKASDLASDAIAAHVASCQPCLRVLAELERELDSVIEQLRESFCDPPIAAEEAHRVATRLEAFREAWYGSALQQNPAEPAVAPSTDPTTFQLRCPFCHEPSLAGAASGSASIVCPNCRGQFSLALEGTDDQDSHPGARIAHFELLERLGEGSFGTVWKAYDTVLHRLVALKLPRKSHLRSKHVEAFVREARLAAQLQHPGIVHVYEVGVDKDAVYLASELIEGRTLRVALDQHRYSAREAAALCLAVTEAVGTAHTAGMVHRDLKPANILLDAAGNPHIADFGLAKHVAIDVVATVEGRVLGTPMYMSPEQAYGDGVVIDARSDIYSIGTILYELLTGRPPFDGDIHLLVAKILLEEPTPPRTLRENLPRDLETICLKCLEKSSGRRYQTAEELATDLRLYLEGKPVRARPITRLARCWRWSRRNPLLSTVSAVALLLLISTVAALAVGNWRTGAALQVAERNLYFHSLASAQQRWLANDPRTADAILDQCPEGLRNFEWGYLKYLVRTPVRRLYNAGGTVAYRPDGSSLATGGGREPSLKIWNAENDQRMHRLIGHEDALVATVFDSSGARIASAGQADKTVQVWDAASGRRLHVFAEHRWPVDDCAFSPDGSQVLAYDRDNQVHVWDLASGECVQTMPLHVQRVRDVAFSPVAPRLAVASRRGESSELLIYDYQTQTLVKRIPAFETTIGSLAFSADGSRLAAGEVRRAIRVWQVEPELHLLATLAGPVADKCRVVFDASGERVAAEAYDGTIRIWELARGETVAILRGHSRPVYQLAFSPDGKQLAAGVGGNEVCIWDLTTEQGSRVYQVGRAAVNDLAVCPNGRFLAAAFADGKSGSGIGRAAKHATSCRMPARQRGVSHFRPTGPG